MKVTHSSARRSPIARLPALALLAITFAVVCSCSNSSQCEGGATCACYANGTCNPGLTCYSNLCVSTTRDGGADGGIPILGLFGDAGSSNGQGTASSSSGGTGGTASSSGGPGGESSSSGGSALDSSSGGGPQEAGSACRPVALHGVQTMGSSTVTATVTIPVPTQAVAGDLLVAYIAGGDSTATTATAVTAPSDWELVVRTDNGTTGFFAVYSKVATAAEPASYTWNTPSSLGGIIFTSWMLAYEGLDTAQPVDVAVGLDNAPATAAASFATPAIVTTGADELVIASFSGHTLGPAATATPGTWTTPAGVTQIVSTNNAQARSGLSVALRQATAGAVGALFATVAPAQDFAITNAIAFRPCQ